ncbi:MAG: AAA family ATPase [Candidatus Pacearchaeota archaeon]|jgi:septum site-determining protein MinD
MGKILGVLSLKGGVGKTSSVLAIGSCLAESGKKVLLIDCNFSAPNLGICLNVINPEKTIHHVLNNNSSINDAIHSLGNFDLIPASVFNEPLINPLKLKDHLKFVKSKYDFIILDSSPSLNEETLSVMLASDELFVITTPDYPTLSMTLKAIKTAKNRGINITGLILNKVYNKSFELSLESIERTAEIPVLAVIPHDAYFNKAIFNFVPYTLQNPSSRGSVEYKKLAGILTGEKYEPKTFLRYFKRITPKKQDINREIYYETMFK